MTGPSFRRRHRHSLVLAAVFGLALAVSGKANAQIDPYGLGGDFSRGSVLYWYGKSPGPLPPPNFSPSQYMAWAEDGSAAAQFWLSNAYVMGTRGLEQDHVKGLKWLLIAAAGGFGRGAEWYEMVVRRATPAGVAEAQRLAREWLEKHEKGE